MSKIRKALIDLEIGHLANKISKDEIVKARTTKYYKREGSPGNYKYYYTKEEYNKSKGDKSERGEREKEVEHKHDLKEAAQVRESGGKMSRVVDIKGNMVRTSESGQEYIHITKLYYPDGESVIKDAKPETNKKEGGESNVFDRGDEVVVGKYKMTVSGYTDDGRLKVMNVQDEKFTLTKKQTESVEAQAHPKKDSKSLKDIAKNQSKKSLYDAVNDKYGTNFKSGDIDEFEDDEMRKTLDEDDIKSIVEAEKEVIEWDELSPSKQRKIAAEYKQEEERKLFKDFVDKEEESETAIFQNHIDASKRFYKIAKENEPRKEGWTKEMQETWREANEKKRFHEKHAKKLFKKKNPEYNMRKFDKEYLGYFVTSKSDAR